MAKRNSYRDRWDDLGSYLLLGILEAPSFQQTWFLQRTVKMVKESVRFPSLQARSEKSVGL